MLHGTIQSHRGFSSPSHNGIENGIHKAQADRKGAKEERFDETADRKAKEKTQ